MPTPFPATAWNINVIASGSPQGGVNLQGTTWERVGSMPPQTGMPVFITPTELAFGPRTAILTIDQNFGLITIGPSGGFTDPSQQYTRYYGREVNIFYVDALRYGFPSGANNILFQHKIGTMPSGAVRGIDYSGGGGFIYG